MSRIGVVFDLLKKNPNVYSTHTVHSLGSFSTKLAVSGVAASVFAAYPFSFRVFLDSNQGIAFCDAPAPLSDTPATLSDAPATLNDDPITGNHDDYVSKVHNDYVPKDDAIPGYIFETGIHYTGKVYDIELKPLFSAFQWRNFMLTSLRSFLMYYLPLLEPSTVLEDDDEDFLAEHSEEKSMDLVAPFHKSLKQIIRESTVLTTRRALERLAVSYFSQRMAWKLLKDAPKSAMRKAQRGLPTTVYFVAVTRTTLRAHCLGVAASWVVQVGVDIYRTLYRLFNSKDELDEVDKRGELQLLGNKIFGVTVRCTASLLFAAIGAGVGATCIRPTLGQWIGCALGDLGGPVIVALLFDKLLRPVA